MQAECRDVFGRYNGMLHKAAIITTGISLAEQRLTFKWADAFDTNAWVQVDDWGFERAAVLFNLAASISYLATHEDRGTDEGVRNACTLFQQASGTVGVVKEHVAAAAWKHSPDLSADTLSTLETLMLAQAQKCFYEKASLR